MLERDCGWARWVRLALGIRLLLWSLRARHLDRSSVEVHGSCDGRISLYPAAPIRLPARDLTMKTGVRSRKSTSNILSAAVFRHCSHARREM
jgi:hypothetical protein